MIHDKNPLLRGLNWMGSALVMGGAAAGLLLATERVPFVEPIANLCILLAFLFCYRADRQLIGLDTESDSLSVGLLTCQAVAMLSQWLHLTDVRISEAVLSVLVAIQIGTTAHIIQRNGVGKSRQPARVTVGVMYSLIAANLARGVCAAMGMLANAPHAVMLNLLSYSAFVASAIGLAFAFFWRTTTKLSLELEHMASTDPLTRVFNRRVFLSWCESEQTRSLRQHAPFSVLMLDFDHFKRVNDTYGHHVGDQVLCAAVERIQDSIRGIDVLCRWGGEEFAVLLPNASEEATVIVAERVRRNIRLIESSDPRFKDVVYADLQLSASIGTATFEGEDDTFHLMLQRADEALYEAKRTGRNRVVRSSRTRDKVDFAPGHLTLKTP